MKKTILAAAFTFSAIAFGGQLISAQACDGSCKKKPSTTTPAPAPAPVPAPK